MLNWFKNRFRPTPPPPQPAPVSGLHPVEDVTYTYVGPKTFNMKIYDYEYNLVEVVLQPLEFKYPRVILTSTASNTIARTGMASRFDIFDENDELIISGPVLTDGLYKPSNCILMDTVHFREYGVLSINQFTCEQLAWWTIEIKFPFMRSTGELL